MEGVLPKTLLGSCRVALGGNMPYRPTCFLVEMDRVLGVQLIPYIGESWRMGGTREGKRRDTVRCGSFWFISEVVSTLTRLVSNPGSTPG